jgi:hypothetical protein
MKTIRERDLLARIRSSSLTLAAILALAISAARICRAQTAATPKPTPAASREANNSAQKGQSEGIKVHGHWTIEVRNSDGTLATHREFENSLATASNAGGNGAGILAALLGRVVSAGSWNIALTGPSQSYAIYINEPNSDASSYCVTQAAYYKSENDVAVCSNNLTLQGPQLSLADGTLTGGTLTFSGSATIPQGFPATITYVQTETFVCAASDSPPACTTDSASILSAFTARQLDGLNGDPAAVPVSSGQTVNVTVVISFQ